MPVEVFDVFVAYPPLVDSVVYSLWLRGVPLEQVAFRHDEREAPQEGAALDADTADQYRLFAMLEPFLMEPSTLWRQQVFPLSGSVRRALLDGYFGFDDPVFREFVGKKLSAKTRRELDEISERTGVSPRSCRRQFENLRRVQKAVEETPADLTGAIRQSFHLSTEMSRQAADPRGGGGLLAEPATRPERLALPPSAPPHAPAQEVRPDAVHVQQPTGHGQAAAGPPDLRRPDDVRRGVHGHVGRHSGGGVARQHRSRPCARPA
jgi:hypothetical protein